MRYILILIVLASCFVGCSVNKERQKQVATTCSAVTDQNWNKPSWSAHVARKMCEERLALHDNMDPTMPCTFGGLAFFCTQHKDSSMTIRQVVSGNAVITISKEDLPKATPHIVIIK